MCCFFPWALAGRWDLHFEYFPARHFIHEECTAYIRIIRINSTVVFFSKMYSFLYFWVFQTRHINLSKDYLYDSCFVFLIVVLSIVSSIQIDSPSDVSSHQESMFKLRIVIVWQVFLFCFCFFSDSVFILQYMTFKLNMCWPVLAGTPVVASN